MGEKTQVEEPAIDSAIADNINQENLSQDESIQQEPEGNMDMADLVRGLTKKYEAPTEEPKEEDSETLPVGLTGIQNSDNSEEEDAEQSPVQESGEEAEESEATKSESSDEVQDVLSKLGIDIDELDEGTIGQLSRALGNKSLKRFGRLTAQKRELQEEIASTKEKLAQLENQQQEVVYQPQQTSEYGNLNSFEDISKKELEYQAVIDWVDDNLDNDAIDIDDNGNEIIAKSKDHTFTKKQLKELKRNATRELRPQGGLSKRKAFIAEKLQSDKLAMETFDWTNNAESQEFQQLIALSKDPLFSQLDNIFPNANYMKALMIEGTKALSGATARPKARTQSIPKAPVADSNSANQTITRNANRSQAEKQLEAAEKRYEETGDMDDFVRLQTLQRQFKK